MKADPASFSGTYSPKFGKIVIVAKTGGDYSTIQAANASITDSAADNPYTILVCPGAYTGSITLHDYVSVVGIDKQSTVISLTASDPNLILLNLGVNSSVRNLTLSLTNVDEMSNVASAIYSEAASGTNEVIDVDISLTTADAPAIGVWFVSGNNLEAENVYITGSGGGATEGMQLEDGAHLIKDSYISCNYASILNVSPSVASTLHCYLSLAGDNTTSLDEYYTKSESDSNYVNTAGDTMTGNLVVPTLQVTSGAAVEQNSLQTFWAFRYADGVGADNTGLRFNVGTGDFEFAYLNNTKFSIDAATGDAKGYRNLEIVGDVDAATGTIDTFDATAATLGGIALTTFQTNGGWIDMPIGAAAGIGHGGAGATAWVGYAYGAGDWFADSSAGDICYRTEGGARQLFGNDYTGNAGLIIDSDNVIAANELMGCRECLTAGTSSAITASSFASTNGVPMSSTVGFRAIRAGSIVGMSANLDITAQTTQGNIVIRVKRNDALVYPMTIASNGVAVVNGYSTQARGLDTFVAGDLLTFYIYFSTFVGTIGSSVLLMEIVYDT